MSPVAQVHCLLHLMWHELVNQATFSQHVGAGGWSCAYESCRVLLGSSFALPWAHLGFLVDPGRESKHPPIGAIWSKIHIFLKPDVSTDPIGRFSSYFDRFLSLTPTEIDIRALAPQQQLILRLSFGLRPEKNAFSQITLRKKRFCSKYVQKRPNFDKVLLANRF